MKKILFSVTFLLFTIFSSQAYNKVVSTKSNTNNIEKIQKKLIQKKIALPCGLEGQVWSQVVVIDCPDGTTSTAIFSGIAWELTCSNEFGGVYLYAAFITDVDYFYVGGGC